VAWRQNCTKKFVFNPGEPVNQNDLLNLKTKIANRRVELERKIRASAGSLQSQSSIIVEQRKKLVASANQVYGSLKQAEADANNASGLFRKTSQYISICCAAIAAIGLLQPSSAVREATRTELVIISKSSPPSSTPNGRMAAPPRSQTGNSSGPKIASSGVAGSSGGIKEPAPAGPLSLPPSRSASAGSDFSVPANSNDKVESPPPPANTANRELDTKVFGPYSPEWPARPLLREESGGSTSGPMPPGDKTALQSTGETAPPALPPAIVIGPTQGPGGGINNSAARNKKN
jgi:hypothetical protein